METLKKQLECGCHFWNIYSHNAQLMSIATQSLSVELMLLNLLKAYGDGLCQPPWAMVDVQQWKAYLEDYDTEQFWDFDDREPEELHFAMPSEFDLNSLLLVHHVSKEREDGRADYDLVDGKVQPDNANALTFALRHLSAMSPYYAAEVAEDAILQLGVTFNELERLMLEDNLQATGAYVEKRIKAGRKAVSCFLPKASTTTFRRAFRSFMEDISTDDGKVLLGHQEYDRKYVFVLLYYRFIRAGLMHRKINVTCYSQFIVSALELSVNAPSFRKNVSNWMQKIDLYGCTFQELTREMIDKKRYHPQQLTLDEFEVWSLVDKELGKAIDRSGAFEGFL